MKLFKVEHPKMETVYFDRKWAAKNYRDTCNQLDSSRGRVIVQRGPDHWRGES